MNILHNLPNVNKAQLAECHIPYTVSSANIFTVQCVCGRRQAPDIARSTIGIQRDGVHSAISIQAETERGDILACY